jgi:multisubunit Na+/H+ antiporter MnhG subunit
MKTEFILKIICIIISTVFAIFGFLGIWILNPFGTGMLWLIIAALTVVWALDTYNKMKQKEK